MPRDLRAGSCSREQAHPGSPDPSPRSSRSARFPVVARVDVGSRGPFSGGGGGHLVAERDREPGGGHRRDQDDRRPPRRQFDGESGGRMTLRDCQAAWSPSAQVMRPSQMFAAHSSWPKQLEKERSRSMTATLEQTLYRSVVDEDFRALVAASPDLFGL